MASAVLLLLLLLLPSASSSEDLQLLLSFKASLPNPDALRTWLPSADPCSSFQGVSCSPSTRAITSLRLDSLPLATNIRHVASHLFPLPSLISLSLRDTNLTGLLSAVSVSRCSPVIADLDLSSNSLRGPFTDLAVLTASCPSLLSVNLSGNSLASVVASSPPPLRLEVLDLSLNKILEPSALQWLLSAGSVQLLYLSGNHLTGDIPLPSNCSALRHLDLSNNNLTGISSFSSCGNLQLLNIAGNVISGTVPDDIFGSCRNLLQLDLSFNSLSGPLPAGFAYCTALEAINLSNNNFSGELPVDILNSMNSLKKLQFGFNSFSGKLPDLFAKISGLEVLDFSSNLLAGAIPEALCQSPGGVELKELYLQNNLLTGTIPPSISNCSKLVSLDLSFNFLSGRIPTSVGSLVELQDLHMWENLLEGEIPGELMYAMKLENLILDNNGLTGSIPDGLSNCTNLNWISLSSNHLTGSIPPWIGHFEKLAILKLGNNSLSGPIPPEIGNCKSLIWLDLNSNQLNGSIPLTISKQSGYIAVGLVTGKKYVYLRNDGSRECRGAGNLLEFAGIRPEQLDRVPTRRSCNFTRVYAGATQYTFNNNGSIIFLDLSYNNLEGEIPKELGDMFYVMVVNLGHNQLSGLIPPELGNLRSIGILDLSHNALEGPIPQSFSHLAMLSELDLSYNNLNGSIPEVGQLATFPAYRYENNPGLCGLPLPPCGSNSSLNGDQSRKSRRRQASLAGSIAMGLLFSLFCIFGLIIIAIESKKRKQKRKENGSANGARDPYVDSRSYSGTMGNSTWKQLTATREALSINLLTFENPLRKLTLADLLEATNGFHSDCLVGSGGFGDVYKAELKDGSVVAVKKLIHVSGQGDREFTAEMETIGKIKHRNLVPLLGYCKVQEERLLVYEYMKYGSLEDVLHSKKKAAVKLNWATRRKIAVGAARGLAFLHHNCIPHIIHRDMKSSNVLLDDSLEARVSDFGMARMMSAMDTHLSVSTLAGTPGYVPPEYYQSFRCSTKGDVYSYGVVLLELLTGRRPTDSADFGDNNLVGWVKQHSKLRISDVFDKDLLKEDPTLELELLEHLKIACACLDDRPLRRPNMLKVMAMFKEIQAGSTVDSTASAATGSVDGGFGMVEMSLQECKEERE